MATAAAALAPTREDFAALLEESMTQGSPQEGSVVKGIIVGIEKDMAVEHVFNHSFEAGADLHSVRVLICQGSFVGLTKSAVITDITYYKTSPVINS